MGGCQLSAQYGLAGAYGKVQLRYFLKDCMSYLLRAGLSRSSRNVPLALRRFPYDVMLGAVRRILKDGRTTVWPRNSLALGYWEFGSSDIDLSVWVEGGAQEVRQTWSRVQPWKWMLLGGETQIYSSSMIERFLSYANPFELMRDPLLIEKLGYPHLRKSEGQKTTFLARMLLADHVLKFDHHAHAGKWGHHLRFMGYSEATPKDFGSLVELLHQTEAFKEFSFEELAETILMPKPQSQLQTSFLQKLLYSNHHPWLDQAKAKDIEDLGKASQAQHEYLAHMIEWEIWGLFPMTIVIHGIPFKGLEHHILNQTRLLEHLRLSSDKKMHIQAGFTQLLDLYRLCESEVQ